MLVGLLAVLAEQRFRESNQPSASPPALDSRYGTMAAYSKGMRQRVLLAAALMHNPDLLVLDEPFSGLDVTAGLLFRTLLRLFAAGDRMVLFSTHRFDIVEQLCSRVMILSGGRIAAEHDVASFRDAGSPSLEEVVRPRHGPGRLHTGGPADPRRHAAGMTLTRHFFRALFDFGIFTEAGTDSFKRMLLGGIGIFYGAGFLLPRMLAGKYAMLSAASSPVPYRRALLGDDLLIIGLPMLLVAFVTLLVSHSLFPDERDFRILGPLPVRRSVVFGAKLAALLLFTGLFIAAAHVSLVPLMLLTSMNPWREHAVLSRFATLAIVSVGASAFTVLAVTAIVGVLVLALSRSRLHALTAMVKSAMFAVLVLCVPLVFHLPAIGNSLADGSAWLTLVPPAWFVGLQRVLSHRRPLVRALLASLSRWALLP